uniref:phytosulfokine receptor 1-like n=1 Tax=Erigeron canadensis TaxID=72917 RepID=UPI001CB94F3D|nr:phytosulfokine receptor 1-like [Erigeron canadensis]
MVVQLEIWLVLSVLVVSIHNQVLGISHNLTCNSNDLKGLQGITNGMESPIEGWFSSGNLSDCCKWAGVTCNTSSGRIVELQFSKKGLIGKLSDSFSFLDQLKSLNLSHNYLRGPLPFSIFHLGNLEVVDLSSNAFNGVLPVSINLLKLQVLNVSDNYLNGALPSGLCVNSTRIRILSFAVNYLNGTIPPEFGNCRFLEHLSLASNFHYGEIPGFLFGLPRLRELALQDNMLTSFPGISNSSSRLVRLDVSSNMISGKLPDFFGSFLNLNYFIAHSNNLSGRIPLSLSNSPTLSSVNLRNNSLDGSIDINCLAMVNLSSLDLGSNNFLGTIPANLASCRKLKTLNLARNKLRGQIPESFKNFQSLSYLSLSNCSFNNLSSSLEILQHCHNLTVLVLTMNFHNEQLPSDDDLQFKALKALIISNCKLTGSIPSWLNGLTQLQLLDLSWNLLTGLIPPYFGDFKNLFYLDLSNNSLSGEIPKNLTQLQSLISRDISLEEPSPDFTLFRRENNIRDRGSALQYNQIMHFLPSIDLSSNLFTGPIWPEFGNLNKLYVLDLKHNRLSGLIPSSLSGMRSIETLDLSYNSLTGKIPPSLVNLSFLSKFSVAYNNLTGIVPLGGQFATFLDSSFKGNPGLCVALAENCQKNQERWQPPASEDEEFPILHMLVITGFGSGFLATVISLLVVPRIARPL